MARFTKFENFSLCSTNTGWFASCCCCYKGSDIASVLGVGVSVYFKQTKNLVIILLLCTLLSLPAYALFWSGNVLNNPDTTQESGLDFKTSLAALSLANLGEFETMSLEFKLGSETQAAHLYCEHGIIGQMQGHGVAIPTPATDDSDYESDTYCEVTALPNRQNYLEECYKNKFCKIDWKLPKAVDFIDTCTEIDLTRIAEFHLFMLYDCDISTVDLMYFGPMARNDLANIVILCDALICLLWAINTCWLGRAIANESNEIDQKNV